MNEESTLLCERCHCSIKKTNSGKILGRPVNGKPELYDMFLVCTKCASGLEEKNIVGLDGIQRAYLMYLATAILAETPSVIWSQSSLKKYLKWGLVLHPELFADMTEDDIDRETYRVGP